MNKATENKGFIYEFGKFVLDPQERILFADGQPVHLTEKVFDTLLLLIEHNGRLLTKDEMMRSLWEESFVEEGNLTKNISRLRKILNADGIEFIETLPKRGYRFLADVRQIGGEPGLLVHRRLRVKISQSIENGDASNGPGSAALDEIRSIAVLPFQPLGAKPDDVFFGLGITDALITQLNRAGQVQVRPTSAILKYNVPEQNALAVGRELQVDAILEGRFQLVENKFRLTVQMLRTANGESLWADVFNTEVEDIFTVQDKIAGRVIGALSRKLSDEAQAQFEKRDTENIAAYHEYLKGRYFWSKCTMDGYEKALRHFQNAIEIDPHYALAYAGIAGVYNVLPVNDGFAPRDYFPKAKAAALKALEIDATLAEAHTAFGLAVLHYDWNWSGAEVSFQHAIRLDPNYSNAYELLGVYLCRVERVSEAVTALKKAQEIDPLSPINATWLAEVFRFCGETGASVRLHEETLETFPDFYPAHYHLAFSYIDRGDLKKAELHCAKAVSLSRENSLTLSLQGILQAALGNTRAVEETLDKLLRLKAEKYISSANIASVYAASGDEGKTLEWLETALEERDPNLTWIKFDKEFGFLEQHPRFQNILQEVGLAERKSLQPKSEIRNPKSKIALAAVVLLAAVLGIYFWKREKFVAANHENEFIRLTDAPLDDNHPQWGAANQIYFFRHVEKGRAESFVMNADGSNQRRANESIKNMRTGVLSPDGTKLLFYKDGDDKSMYLANADGSDEIKFPEAVGNMDWSPDSKRIVFQNGFITGDSDLYIYTLETRRIENITNAPTFEADPDFSPDGKQIVFVSSRDGNAEIYLMNADGSNIRRLTNHPAWDNHPAFSPDGTQIAFNSDRENENSDIYLMNADGGDVRHLTDSKANEEGNPRGWSPDGTQIAFTSDRDGSDDIFVVSAEIYRPRLVLADQASNLRYPSYSPDGKSIVFEAETPDKTGEIGIFDVESKQRRSVLKTENWDGTPGWSPDGEWLVFHNKIDSNTEVCLIKPDGSGFQNLTRNAARDVSAAFSPDGKQIVFSSNRDGNFGVYYLYLMNADGTNQRRINTTLGYSFIFASGWSPDAKKIVFTNDEEQTGNFEIFSLEPDTPSAVKRLTFRRRADSQPAFSPDGKLIAFTSNADGNSEIYLMNRDGTNLLRLTRNPADDGTPQFSRDGKRIIFSSSRSGKFALYEMDVF